MDVNMLLSARVAEEVRAVLARRGINKSELARRLGVSHTWVTNRLAGHQEIGLNELQRIAEVLGLTPGDFVVATGAPTIRERTSRRRDRRGVHAEPTLAAVTRPPGRPSNARTSSGRPPSYPTEARRPVVLVQPDIRPAA